MVKITSLSLFLLLLWASCATSQSSGTGTKASPADGIYLGAGRDASPLKSLTQAKLDAVNKYLHDLLGSQYTFYEEKLQSIILSTNNPNQFVKAEALEAVSKSLDTKTGDMVYAIRIPVNREAVKATLAANDIHWPGGAGPTPAIADGPAPAASPAPQPATAEDFGDVATPEEQKFIRVYIDTLVSMVYFDDQSAADPAVMRAGVTQANRWLAANGYDLVDQAQVEKLKDDQRKVYEQEAGSNVSYLQWIAQKLNAGIYIELNAVASSEITTSGGSAQINLLIKCFDPSTGELLGSVPFNTPKVVSTASTIDAQIRAIQPAVWQALPVALDQVKAKLAKNLIRGIKYDLIVEKTSDPKLMSQFRRKLEGQVKLLKTVSASADETRYEVFFLGSASSLGDLVDKVAGTVPGLDGMYQVLLRGRALTYNTGL